MEKYLIDFSVAENLRLNGHFVLLRLVAPTELPDMLPGQFAEVRIDDEPGVLLRRPISINYVDAKRREIGLLIQVVGKGTSRLARLDKGDTVNLLLPLGNGFTIPQGSDSRLLLVGGGAGTAPMLFLGQRLSERGLHPTFLLGAKSKSDLFQLDDFAACGTLCLCTEDGSLGEQGFVTQHSILKNEMFDFVYACGPTPMMKAVARYAKTTGTPCEVSLENKMACGLGACLCCVENTTEGNLCVCKEGPVFNINRLTWQI